jgi:hypothetical protein
MYFHVSDSSLGVEMISYFYFQPFIYPSDCNNNLITRAQLMLEDKKVSILWDKIANGSLHFWAFIYDSVKIGLKKENVTKTTKVINSVMFYKKTIKNVSRIFSCNLVEISTSRRQETIKKIFWPVACTTKISTFEIFT